MSSLTKLSIPICLALMSASCMAASPPSDVAANVVTLEKLGGTVEYGNPGQRSQVKGLTLDRVKDVAKALELAKSFASLRSLQISQTTMSRQAIRELRGFNQLKDLVIQDVPLSDRDVSALLGDMPQLESLSLGNTGASDAGLADLAKLTQLRALYLFGHKVTGTALRALPKLTHLTRLTLAEEKVDDSVIPLLARTRSLKQIAITGTKITPGAADTLRKRLPGALVIYLPRNPEDRPHGDKHGGPE